MPTVKTKGAIGRLYNYPKKSDFLVVFHAKVQLPMSFGMEILPSIKQSTKIAIFLSFLAADGQIRGQMSIQLA